VNEHRQAILDRLRAHQYLTVLDGPADGTQAPPYVVVYVTVPDERRTKLCGDTDETWITVTTHSVAENPTGASIVAKNVRQQLLDFRPAVLGWACSRIGHELGRAPDTSTIAGQTYLDAVDEWDYRAEPV
jgi:hypothetical protein